LSSQVVVATSDGRAFAWGANDFGQAGGNNKAARFKAMYNVGQRPLQLAFPGAVSADKVVDVGAGFVHSYAITCQFN
jgi:alpha-tubulin suppressor-like RCC1 family protein